MHRLSLIALALVACNKDAPEPNEPAPVARTDDGSKPDDAPVTCEEVVRNPLIAARPGIPEMFLKFCQDHPDATSQETLRCMRDAPSEDALDRCGDDDVPDEAPETTGAARLSEAELNLEAIRKGAKAYYAEHAAFPDGTAPLSPADPCCDSARMDRKCEVDAALWASTDPDHPLVWDDLNFQIEAPHFYQYAYERTDTGFVATAVGDLDCDDDFATFTLEATLEADGPVYTLTKPARID